ncbi:MAG: tetratricopeptide repeat protein [Acidobacteria bacterium]|nr:tetratricopeptide repeat protein [Acidobacteriota bacterium]
MVSFAGVAALILALLQTQQAPLGPAQAQLAQGNAAGAAELLTEIVESDPEHGRAWLMLGVAKQREGDLDTALSATQRALHIVGSNPQASYRLGLVLGARGDLDAAFKELFAVRDLGTYNLTNIGVDPDASALREDPRWAELFPNKAAYDAPFVEEARILGDWHGDEEGGQFGWIAREIGDVDSDGIRDFTTSAPTEGDGGAVYGYSSRTGAELWRVAGDAGASLGSGLEAAGDVDADGVPDVIAGAPTGNYALVISGLSGEVIWRLEAAADNEGLGAQVGDPGDVNGDGHADVVVGAPGADHAAENAGRVYVFSGKDGTVLWTADGSAEGERLGSTVAGGALNGENWIVGGADQGPGGGGIAYLWSGAVDTPRHLYEPLESATSFGAMFASVPGDVDADGVADSYVSDWGDNTLGGFTGRIYVISGATGDTIHTIAGEAAGDGFGIGPADAGDVDGDGHADLIVGAWQHSSAAPAGGKASSIPDGRASSFGNSLRTSWAKRSPSMQPALETSTATVRSIFCSRPPGVQSTALAPDAY